MALVLFVCTFVTVAIQVLPAVTGFPRMPIAVGAFELAGSVAKGVTLRAVGVARVVDVGVVTLEILCLPLDTR